MNLEDYMMKIKKLIPELYDKLSAPKIIYEKSTEKTYILFTCTKLVEEKEYQKLNRILPDKLFGHEVEVRVTSPDLKESFLEDPNKYSKLMLTFMERRFYLGYFHGRTPQKQFQIERSNSSNANDDSDGRLLFLIPDRVSDDGIDKTKIKTKLKNFIYGVFNAKVQVDLETIYDDYYESLGIPEPMDGEGQFNPYDTFDAGDGYVDYDGIFYEY